MGLSPLLLEGWPGRLHGDRKHQKNLQRGESLSQTSSGSLWVWGQLEAGPGVLGMLQGGQAGESPEARSRRGRMFGIWKQLVAWSRSSGISRVLRGAICPGGLLSEAAGGQCCRISLRRGNWSHVEARLGRRHGGCETWGERCGGPRGAAVAIEAAPAPCSLEPGQDEPGAAFEAEVVNSA